MRKVAYFLIFLFLIPVLGATDVRAESDIALEDAGITMVALRNDTLDPVSYTHLRAHET